MWLWYLNEIICQKSFINCLQIGSHHKRWNLEKSSIVLLPQMKVCAAVLIRTQSTTILIFSIIKHILTLQNLPTWRGQKKLSKRNYRKKLKKKKPRKSTTLCNIANWMDRVEIMDIEWICLYILIFHANLNYAR